MSTASLEDLQQDDLAMSVARPLALANKATVAHGTDPAEFLVAIAEESPAAGRVWRIHDGRNSRFSDRYRTRRWALSGCSGSARVLRGRRPESWSESRMR
jgi:hypothetical protein